MKINLPKNDQYSVVRLVVKSPVGSFEMAYGWPHVVAEFDLPDEVCEDEVSVSAMWLDNGSQPVGDIMVLKEAIEPDSVPEPEKSNEEAPVEADETVAQSPPVESDNEKVSEVIDLSRKSRQRRNRK